MLFKYLKRREMFLTGQWEENNVLHFLFYFPEAIIRERSKSFRNHVSYRVSSQAVPNGSIHSHGGTLPAQDFRGCPKEPLYKEGRTARKFCAHGKFHGWQAATRDTCE